MLTNKVMVLKTWEGLMINQVIVWERVKTKIGAKIKGHVWVDSCASGTQNSIFFIFS